VISKPTEGTFYPAELLSAKVRRKPREGRAKHHQDCLGDIRPLRIEQIPAKNTQIVSVNRVCEGMLDEDRDGIERAE
jgi:hypothetical protein